MNRYMLIATALICTAALAAPAASAQTQPFGATYTENFAALFAHSPLCPDDAFGCGTGTAAGLGAFTIATSFDDACGCRVNTLTLSDGSTLVFDEDFISFTGPGGSASSHAPDSSEGHPGTFGFSWTVASGTGSFAGATGSGTDNLTSAGLIGTGTLSGTITTP
jgi:hypothetical protein